MSDLDVSKMKVAELRAELQQRGLDTKGVKAVLQTRLQDALDEELADSPAKESTEGDEEQVDEVAQEASELLEPQEENTDPEADQEEAAEGEELPEEVMEEDSKPEPQEAEEDISDVKKEEPESTAQEFMEVKDEVKEEGTEVDDQVANVKAEVTEVKEEVMEVKDEVEDEVTEVKEEAKKDEGDKKIDKKDVKQEGEDRDREKRDDRGRNHKGRRDRSPRRRSPPPVVMEEDDDIPETQCVLSKYISDLNLKVAKEGYSAAPLSMDGFAFLWSGVRTTHGIAKGKVCYQVKLVEHMDVKHLPEDEKTPHVVRVGWSLDKTSLQLGEEPLSYGYGGTAKFSTNCKFQNYGEKFTKGDVITAYLDFEGEKPVISYAKNDKDLGVAHTIEDDLEGAPLFPHILVKNTSIEVNLGQKEEPYFPVTEGFSFVGSLPEEDRVRGPIPPPEKKDCEIIMMVGLPGAGKTTWAEQYVKEHPEKKYYILGTNLIMDKMKVMGLRRQRNYAGRFDSLIDKSTKCLNRFFEMAPRKKRNYVLDQTNVYPSARRRKMRPFEGFSSKAIVIVPTDEEFKKRIEKRTKEEGKDVPDHAVLEMKANFELPVKGELFDEVDFVELPLDEAKPLVEKYRKEGVDKLGPNYRRNRDRNRGGNRDNRSRYDNRSPRGGNRSGGYQSRGGNKNYGGGNYGGGGGGNYGYRDNRNRAGGQGGYGNRSYGDGGSYGGGGGGGYGGSGGNYRQNYGNYGSQGGGYQNRNSGYSQSGGGYNSGYSSGYGSSQQSGSYGGGYSSGYNYNQYSQPSTQQSYGQQYPQQQYQQYYQQQSNQSSYNPYANYYSGYNQGGYNQGR